MKRLLMLAIVFLFCLSTFPISAPQVKAETTNPSSLSGLYAGSSNPGVVWEYKGGTNWEAISPQLGYAVLSLVEYKGDLYAGVITGDNIGRVYRYDGGTNWALVGNNMDSQVASLAVYQDALYAGTGWGSMRLYKYNDRPGDWTLKVDYTPWNGTRSLYVFRDYLLMGDLGMDYFGHWDGTNFHADLQGGGSCVYDYEEYGDYVYAAVWQGRLWRSPDGVNWSLALGDYDGNMWEIETFGDELYMAYDNGELRASSVPDRGRLVYTAPDGIISMATDGDNLYFGTGGEAGYDHAPAGIASVYKYDGTSTMLISDEDKFGAGVQVLLAKAEAAINISPTSGYIGTAVTVTATGFAPNAFLSTTFDGGTMTTAPTTVQADDDGSATFAAIIPAVTPGVHQITVTDGVYVAAANFTVLAPTITLAPDTGSVGTVVTVTATGFAPDTLLSVTFAGMPVTTTPASVITDSNGTATFTILIPDAAPGAKVVWVSDGVLVATAPFFLSAPADTTPPGALNDLSVKEVTADSVALTWTAPGDDGNVGTATTYDIRYSTSPITETNWSSATQVTGEPTPKPAGSTETFTVTGLSLGTTYYFALKTADEVPNWSGLSNVVSATTCAPPRTVYADNSGAFGLFEGMVQNVTLDGVTTVSFDIRPTEIRGWPLPKGVQFWVSIDEIISDQGVLSVQPNEADSMGASFARHRLIAPGTHASFLVSFCRPSRVTFELGFSETAIALTVADSVIPLVPIVGAVTPARVLAFADALDDIPLFASATYHISNAIQAASNREVQLAHAELSQAGQDLIRLAFDQGQRSQLLQAFRDLGVDVTSKGLFRALLRAPAHTLQVFGDVVVLVVQTDFGTAGPIRVALVAT
jgi:hypothetical protein